MNIDPELEIYLRNARTRNDEEYREPTRGRPFRSPLFVFVRLAKAYPSLGELEALAAAEVIEQYLIAWDADGNGDPWQAYFPQSDDPRCEFIDTWDKVKRPHAEVDRAVLAAKHLPLKLKRAHSAKYCEFVSIAGHLQRKINGPILLPCRKFSEILGCEPMSVSRYRALAIKDGFLRLERRGQKVRREADEFHFTVEKFDWKSGDEIDSENLKICVTPDLGCYTDSQETERKKDSHEPKEIKEKERETRTHSNKWKTRLPANGRYIPTSAELAEELERTKHLRGP